MTEFEWFLYGWLAGMATPYVIDLVRVCWREYQIARRDWRRHD